VEGWPVDSVIFKPFRMGDLQKAVQGAFMSRKLEHVSVEAGERYDYYWLIGQCNSRQ